ncbi:MAG: M28 family peptidase [Planctomycetota bacterium]|nr:MAG: M28 family peptidase [Planctomycetota bacterium]
MHGDAMRAVASLAIASLALASCVALQMPGKRARGPLPAPSGELVALESRLRTHVEELAGRIGPRHRSRPGSLGEARDYIEWAWRRSGLTVHREPYASAHGGGVNLWTELGPSAGPLWVVSAHYDTVANSPGADDDASGVAALLELGARLAPEFAAHPERHERLRLVAFDDEETPAPAMGSTFHARALAAQGAEVRGMLSLEMLGAYDTAPDTQRFPVALLGLWYSTRADYLAFVGDWDSRELVRRCVGAFRACSPLPCEGMAAPRALRDIARSDHSQFWKIGVPALMVTDTSEFRYAHYHKRSDTPEKLDYRRLALATDGVAGVVRVLCSRAPNR